MVISACNHECSKKFGKDKYGNQRYRCTLCGKAWNIVPPKTLGTMRIDLPLAEMIIKCLCEGNSVRATARLTGTDPHTVIDLMMLVGGRCKRFMEATIRGVRAADVQIDEAWQYIFCKAKTAKAKQLGEEKGDSYLFTAIERDSKMLLAWHLGKRDQWNTDTFCARLAMAVTGQFQISSDGWHAYPSAVIRYMGKRVSHGVVVKTFGIPEEYRKYSPAPIVAIQKKAVWNLPEESKICTSHCERMNLNLRTFVRRMTRLSNGFSKKWENHEAMIALFIAHYNFVRIHGSLKTTPAVASGLEASKWSVKSLLEKTATF